MRMIPSFRPVLFALALLAMSMPSFAQVRISVAFGPPALPVYEQPLCPGDGYIWTPGYWAWDDDGEDYYWVPGTWVLAPEVVSFGPRPIGLGRTARSFSMTAIGVPMSVSMAELFMALAISVSAS